MAELTRRQFFKLSGVALFAATVMPTVLIEEPPVFCHDTLTIDQIRKAKQIAEKSLPQMRPVRIEGMDYYVIWEEV